MKSKLSLLLFFFTTFFYSQERTPTFDQVQEICAGGQLNPLPSVSLEGFTGSWTPELNYFEPTVYTFTPDPGQKATTATMLINVKNLTIPTFADIYDICPGEYINDIPTTSQEGISGLWEPALNNLETTTYTFTPYEGQCAGQTTLTIAVIPANIPSFNDVNAICYGESLDALPNVSLESISGQWSPALNNTVTTTYTFTPSPGQCAASTTLTIVVNPRIIPSFEKLSPICSEISSNILPSVSLEGVYGTWSPEFNNLQTTSYTFTPDEGQCAGAVGMTIEVINSEKPIFENVHPICLGDELYPLTTLSNNNISGTWSPELDMTTTTTYTFTPDAGQCALVTEMTIIVNPIIPEFEPVKAICLGGGLEDLPTISKDGISGSWSPELNNLITTTYTFTPEEGQCASPVDLTIVVHPFEADFSSLQICVGTKPTSLPVISDNGITGVWKSDGSSYNFYPDKGQCAEGYITIQAVPTVIPEFDPIDPIAQGNGFELPSMSVNGISGVWTPEIDNQQTTTYTFTPTPGQCAESVELTVEVNAARFSGIDFEENAGLMGQENLLTANLTGSSNEVGITSGQLSVTPSGSSSYNLPILVPPGINGIEPNISLSYSSDAGVGNAGYGWNIGGISAITRIPATKFHDGLPDPVDFDSTDRFALDGQRLMLKSGSYGAAGSIYETEQFSNTKITFSGTYFKVDYPDGSSAFYGQNSNSQAGITYGITYWENFQGIRISYDYINSNNLLYINSVKFGTKGTVTPINEVKFTYKNRAYKEQAYISGFNFINDKILQSINVKGNNTAIRNYYLGYDFASGYERLKSITEKNGQATKYFNPTTFSYENEEFTNNVTRTTTENFIDGITAIEGAIQIISGVLFKMPREMSFRTKPLVNGDFDGDGDQDFVYENRLYTKINDNGSLPVITNFSALTSSIDNIGSRFPAKVLVQNSQGAYQLLNRDAWCIKDRTPIYDSTYPTNITYHLYALNSANTAVNELYSKAVTINAPSVLVEEFNGDFNGDGLTDQLILKNNSLDNLHSGEFFFVNLDQRLSANYIKSVGSVDNITCKAQFRFDNYRGTYTYVADMNADGKSDIVVFKGGSVNKITVYTLDDSNNNLITLWETPIKFIHNDSDKKKDRIFYEEKKVASLPSIYWPTQLIDFYKPFYYDPIFADLNGDGNTDVILPGFERKVLMSTGLYLATESLPNTFPPRQEANAFLPTDSDGDGKTDIVAIRKTGDNSFSINKLSRKNTGLWTTVISNFNNTNNSNPYCGNFVTDLKPFMIKSSKVYSDKPQILVMEYQHGEDCYDDFKIGFYTFKNTMSINKSLNRITYGNGIREHIYYGQLVIGNLYSSAGQIANYPNYDISGNATLRVVDHISREIAPNIYKYQYYKYYGATGNAEGLGFLGFRSIMNTNWFSDFSKIISNVTINDPNLRGNPVQSFSVEGMVPATKTLQAADPFISKAIFTYNSNLSVTPLLSNKVYKLRNTFTQKTNGLDGSVVDVTSTYDSYNLKTVKTFMHGTNSAESKTVDEEYEYDNMPNSYPYMIGRPYFKRITSKLSNDTSISEEEYTYSSNLLTDIRKRSTNSGVTTDYVTESKAYDTYGNVVSTTLSAPGMVNRNTSYQFDPQTHRFITKSVDIYGLSTDYTYNLSNGNLLTKTLPSSQAFPVKIAFGYDSWGKETSTTHYLGSTQLLSYTNTYTNIPEGVQKLTVGTDNSGSKLIVDYNGRQIHEQKKDINDKWSCISTIYDVNNNILKVSKPYFISGNNLGTFTVWNETQYDLYGRTTQVNNLKSVSSNGKQISYSYSGLSRTENDGQKQKTVVNTVYGAVNQVSEAGGETINYSYFANGNLKSTSVGSAQTIIEQDGFGRKKKLIDPSAGTYSYLYNNFGEQTSEAILNKGITVFDRDNFGRIRTKTITGSGADLTNSTTQYTYNAFNQVSQMLFIDDANDYRISYLYEFDNFNRLKSSREVRNSSASSKKYFDFQKEYLYDSYGRADREHFIAKDVLTNKSADKWVKSIFKNGGIYQLYDMSSSTATTNVKLWQTNLTDASGNVLTATLGNGINISNIYDNRGLPALFSHQKGSVNVMSLFSIFTPSDNNLKLRQHIMPNMFWTENLLYDNFDRLTTYKGAKGFVTQSYNSNGTIAQNNLGSYDYTASGRPYLQTSFLAANSQTFDYYQNREQNITYNVFNSPTSVSVEDVENIDFEYNPFNQRAVMFYGDMTKKEERTMRKFYNDDGTMEIRRKTTKNGSSNDFTFYIGGDGYTAPVILRTVNSNKDYYYLHRDYQGSIMAITGSLGNIVEKRIYDAWGQMVQYNGVKTTVPTDNVTMFLDRGYTGHEHLLNVDLINMNGRIYDPKIHRFLQPDNYVQDPLNIENYNRFGYCLNNPTKFTDPSGESWLGILGFAFSAYVHGGQATGQANPLKWSSAETVNAFMGAASSLLSSNLTNYANSYIDNYNKGSMLNGSFGNITVDSSYLKIDYSWSELKNDYLHMMRSADSWAEGEGGQAWGEFVAGMNPIVSTYNAYLGITESHDMYGHEMSNVDTAMTVASIIPYGKVTKYFKFSNFEDDVVKGIGSLFKGKTFQQYKAIRGGTETLAKIETSTGIQRISTEFHHVFISQRMQRAYDIPNIIVNNRINVWKLNTIQHSLIDPYRYNFLRAGIKPQVGWFKEYNWFTKF